MQTIDVISSSLRLIGSLGQGEVPNNDEAVDVFNRLNDMLDIWSTERLMIPVLADQIFNLVIGKQTYQIGPGAADFNVARPVFIQNANIVVATLGLRIPMDLVSTAKWASITERGTSAQVPKQLYYDKAFPIGNLNLFPTPSAAFQLELFTWTPIAQFVTLQDSVIVPPGYLRALQYNLAVNIAGEFGMQVTPEVVQIAMESKNGVRSINAQFLASAESDATTGNTPTLGIPPGAVPLAISEVAPGPQDGQPGAVAQQ